MRTQFEVKMGHDLTFVDLFCGIGGMRLGFEQAGCRCVFSSDWDKYAQQTYAANFGETPVGNIREIDSSSIPDHDILVGGFSPPTILHLWCIEKE